MSKCYHCGNDYDKTFAVTMPDGETYHFDSFECAIHAMAPHCSHCDCRIIGHGIEHDGSFYCCAHCAHEAGVQGAHDRV